MLSCNHYMFLEPAELPDCRKPADRSGCVARVCLGGVECTRWSGGHASNSRQRRAEFAGNRGDGHDPWYIIWSLEGPPFWPLLPRAAPEKVGSFCRCTVYTVGTVGRGYCTMYTEYTVGTVYTLYIVGTYCTFPGCNCAAKMPQ